MLALVIALVLLSPPAAARDLGQWGDQPTYVRQWFKKLMQPDNPVMSCCGEADAYWADSFEVNDGRYVAIITDDRPDGPLGRPHREIGERIIVPNHKIKWDEGNPTGHGIIFIGGGGQVYCYITPGGV
jgi:Sex factor F TraW protein N terminal